MPKYFSDYKGWVMDRLKDQELWNSTRGGNSKWIQDWMNQLIGKDESGVEYSLWREIACLLDELGE